VSRLDVSEFVFSNRILSLCLKQLRCVLPELR